MLDEKLLDLHLRSYRACLVRVDLAIIVAVIASATNVYWRLTHTLAGPSSVSSSPDSASWETELSGLLCWTVFILAGLIGWYYHNRCRSIAKTNIPIKILPGIAAYPGILLGSLPIRFIFGLIPVAMGAYAIPDFLPRFFGDEMRHFVETQTIFSARMEQPLRLANQFLERLPYFLPNLILWLKTLSYGSFVRSW